MSSKVYITILGRYVWAMVNTYHAVMREKEFKPDKIYIYTEKSFEKEAEKGREAMHMINEAYDNISDIEIIAVDDVDFVSAGKQLKDKIDMLNDERCEISLDITPGRKPLVVGALLPAKNSPLNHVYYLEIADLKDVSKPYMQIPMSKQKLWDFREAVG